jgi:hypothetical protein
MISTGQTYDTVTASEERARNEPQGTLMGHIIADFFKDMEDKRADEEEARAWRGVD